MKQISIRHIFSRACLILYCLGLSAFSVAYALAETPAPVTGSAKLAENSPLPWTIQADKLMYDQEKQLYEAEGNVKISAKDRLIEADYASVNNQTRQADLSGKVTVAYGRNWVKGEHVIWNLDKETGWLDSGVLFFAENNFFIQGKEITKTSATEYELKEGFLTSCNPAEPDWKIQFNDMKVTVGGTAWTRDVSLWARDWPVVYWPLLGVPVETQRQSGFLLPIEGHSTLNGYQIEIPYYWAFRPDMDATFYAEYMSNRGLMGGAEYRIDNQQWGKGIWAINYLDDQVSKTFLFNQGFPFQTQDRYWLRGKQDIALPWNIEAKIDLDYVSDPNFLQEFALGSPSLYRSSNMFLGNFGRGLLYDPTSLVRESDVYLEKRGDSELLSMDFRYWENFETGFKDQTTQMLPSFSYDVIPKRIDDTAFYWGLESSAVNYWKVEGDTEQRLDAYPRAYYPLHFGNYLDVESSVGLRADAYSVQWATTNGNDNLVERAIPDTQVEMSTRLNREFNVDFWNLVALQNAIRPEISYEYATQTASGPVAQIDQLDANQSRNGIRYGFSTFFTGKELLPSPSGESSPTYIELARFRVFQFFNVQAPPIEDPMFDTDNIMKQGFSPIGFRLDVKPRKYVTVSYDLDLDLSTAGQQRAQDFSLTYDSTVGHIVTVTYAQVPNLAVNEITVATYLKTYKDFYINTYHDYALDAGLMFTQGYGVRYIRGCWGVGLGYERTGGDNRVALTLDLMGIGSIGSSSAFFGKPFFGEVLPGYQHPESWISSR
ncbi:Organic solvent tolerance protein [Syntrophobacter sp. SbD1]|nr:Organic solvent tolerance protein [Syntrophobacter sp. SbD1]